MNNVNKEINLNDIEYGSFFRLKNELIGFVFVARWLTKTETGWMRHCEFVSQGLEGPVVQRRKEYYFHPYTVVNLEPLD